MTQTTLEPVHPFEMQVDTRKEPSLTEVLEAIDRLSKEDREELYELTRKRRIEANRARMLAAAEEARRDYAAGNYRVMTPGQIVDEIFS